MRKHNRTTIRANEINLSLGNSIISVLVWMGFAVVVIAAGITIAFPQCDVHLIHEG